MVSVGWWRARRQQRRVSKPSSSTRASFSFLRRATLPCRALASRPHPPSQAPPLSARGADIYSGGKRSRSFERSRRGSAARAALRPPPAPVPALRDGERRYRARECNDVWLETHPASSSRTPPRVAGEAQRAVRERRSISLQLQRQPCISRNRSLMFEVRGRSSGEPYGCTVALP